MTLHRFHFLRIFRIAKTFGNVKGGGILFLHGFDCGFVVQELLPHKARETSLLCDLTHMGKRDRFKPFPMSLVRY